MLNIRFCSGAEFTQDEIIVDEPYRQLVHFIDDDIQRDAPSAEYLAQRLRGIIAGTAPPLQDANGNVWTMDVDANVARLACYFRTPVAKIELPTAELLYALEAWRDHLIAKERA